MKLPKKTLQTLEIEVGVSLFQLRDVHGVTHLLVIVAAAGCPRVHGGMEHVLRTRWENPKVKTLSV
jgi:hypothetical protein